ncbi:hypothetical protein [Galliscardovia ingluviei]|nr:hypothetical protein [Galliscardovia ingluviei]
MSEFTWMSTVAQFKSAAAMVDAAAVGNRLVALWPLHDHVRIDNDVKYAEDLQVRITRQIAQILSGERVTMPDAEYVYEGADEIPGRPQSIVEALLAANDAYDAAAAFSEDADASHLAESAQIIEACQGQKQDTLVDVLHEVTQQVEHVSTLPFDERAAWVGAVVAQLCALLTASNDIGTDADRNIAVVMLAAIECAELAGVPAVFAKLDQWKALSAQAVRGDVDAVATQFAQIAQAEWQKHYDDVLWDPEEAKKQAKEEDERKSREALAAKFAHIQDDPNKEAVEL